MANRTGTLGMKVLERVCAHDERKIGEIEDQFPDLSNVMVSLGR